MRNALIIGAILIAAFYWVYHQVVEQLNPFGSMKAGVLQTPGPLSLTDVRSRSDCPIPLPDAATNIQYAVWSLWQASQTFVRFDAPVSDCLTHAETVMEPFAQRAAAGIASTNIVGPLPAPSVLSPRDLSVAGFDLPRFSAGIRFQMVDGRAPTVWVDTNRGCFYYEWNRCYGRNNKIFK